MYSLPLFFFFASFSFHIRSPGAQPPVLRGPWRDLHVVVFWIVFTFLEAMKAAPFEPAEESQGACWLVDPKGDQEQDQARRGALPGAKNTWSQGLEDCPDMSCHPHLSLCRLLPRGRNHGHLQHLNFMSLCPWRETALFFFSFQVRNLGAHC